VVIAIVFGSVGQMIGGVEESLEEKPVIGIVDIDDGDFSDIAMSVGMHPVLTGEVDKV